MRWTLVEARAERLLGEGIGIEVEGKVEGGEG